MNALTLQRAYRLSYLAMWSLIALSITSVIAYFIFCLVRYGGYSAAGFTAKVENGRYYLFAAGGLKVAYKVAYKEVSRNDYLICTMLERRKLCVHRVDNPVHELGSDAQRTCRKGFSVQR